MNNQLPGASNTLTFGILSLVLVFVCCGPFAAIFSFIALSSAKKAEKIHLENPGAYTGIENVKTGRILAYIGLALSAIALILLIIYFGVIIAFVASGALEGSA